MFDGYFMPGIGLALMPAPEQTTISIVLPLACATHNFSVPPKANQSAVNRHRLKANWRKRVVDFII
jgi:hypothetical protein